MSSRAWRPSTDFSTPSRRSAETSRLAVSGHVEHRAHFLAGGQPQPAVVLAVFAELEQQPQHAVAPAAGQLGPFVGIVERALPALSGRASGGVRHRQLVDQHPRDAADLDLGAGHPRRPRRSGAGWIPARSGRCVRRAQDRRSPVAAALHAQHAAAHGEPRCRCPAPNRVFAPAQADVGDAVVDLRQRRLVSAPNSANWRTLQEAQTSACGRYVPEACVLVTAIGRGCPMVAVFFPGSGCTARSISRSRACGQRPQGRQGQGCRYDGRLPSCRRSPPVAHVVR